MNINDLIPTAKVIMGYEAILKQYDDPAIDDIRRLGYNEMGLYMVECINKKTGHNIQEVMAIVFGSAAYCKYSQKQIENAIANISLIDIIPDGKRISYTEPYDYQCHIAEHM